MRQNLIGGEGGLNMTENEMNTIIEKTIVAYKNRLKIRQIRYAVDFGDISVQYEISLN